MARTKLEYCYLVWYPHYSNQINAFESVQRTFLKFLAFKVIGIYPERGYPHNELLSYFHLTSLEDRRFQNRMVFLYKLIHNQIDCPNLLSLLYFNTPTHSWRNFFTFYYSTPRTNILQKSPIFTICRNYNTMAHRVDIFNCTLRSLISHCQNP